MDYPRVFPLLDCEMDGSDWLPMFGCKDEHGVASRNAFYLREAIPGHFRLCAGTANALDLPLSFSVRCPYCGNSLNMFGRMTDMTAQSLYTCNKCR